MKVIFLVAAGAATLLSGCTTAPVTAWGKPNVSKTEYGTDIGMCTGFAAGQRTNNESKTAGALDGTNVPAAPPPRPDVEPEIDRPGGPNTASNPNVMGANLPTGSGMYQNNTPQDVVQRAANQEQARIMAAKRARAEKLSSCLTQRGYTEFMLTAEQRQKLSTLTPGSNEYHEYLYSLGADPAVIKSQAAPPAPAQ
jgi:hypothetical protein